MAEDLPLDKLRTYLRELKPEARALLLAEVERAQLRGHQVPAADFLLEELRRDLRGGRAETASELADRIGAPARMFFAPLEPFLIDDAPEQLHRGRIIRTSLEPVWVWLSRDLMPSETKAYSEQITRLHLTNDIAISERLARAFQDQAVHRIREALTAAQDDAKTRQRLAGQIGIPRALDHLREIIGILRARDALAVFASRLPQHIKNLADEQLENIKALLDSPIGGHPDVFVYALVLVMGRLGVPWQLVRLAVHAAESDVAAKIVGTPFAVAIAIVLGEIERILSGLRDDIKRGRFAAASERLKDIYDAARLLRTEMDLSGDSPWARQLTTIRSEISSLVKTEIETVPGRVRRLLRPRKPSEIRSDAVLDASEVEETEALIEFVSVCRNHASELAINEVTLRVHSELQNYLETGTSPLLDALRGGDDAHRAFRLSQVDATVRFAAKVFGPSYASLLAKAAEVAAQDGDRRSRAAASGE
ncbi:MAG: hypothetical protein ACJ8FP_13670 [Xanthobacteraceae bacterium]